MNLDLLIARRKSDAAPARRGGPRQQQRMAEEGAATFDAKARARPYAGAEPLACEDVVDIAGASVDLG